MARRMYRTHRSEYVGAEVIGQALRVHIQQQAMVGPAGWQDQGPRQYVDVPLTRVVCEDVTDALDAVVRSQLRRLWTLETEDGLF